ncbi:unnamed protein product [Spirodela intermedia]|uniref:Uncharacterized protein n=1 Tax=Spirodela intermedia TaxID=51605 RepID=A0A7I8KC74_SPIIN|nr:unnamed protein product [Spirodela intermedia]
MVTVPGNNRGSPSLVQQEEDQPKKPLCKAAILSPPHKRVGSALKQSRE